MEQLRFISLVLAFVASVPLLAQTSQPRQLYVGISAGLARNILAGSEIDFQREIYNNPMSHRTGPAFSVFLKNELTPHVYLKGEASYVRKGNSSPGNALWNLNLEYFSIPLKIGFQPLNFDNSRHLQLGIELGPSINFGTGPGIENLKTAYASGNNVKVSRWALGLNAGTTIEYRLSRRRILFLNSTWYHDFTPLLSYESGNARYKAANQGWLVTAGLMFPVRRQSTGR